MFLYMVNFYIFNIIESIKAFGNTLLRLFQFGLSIQSIRIMNYVTSYIWACTVISNRTVPKSSPYIFLQILIINFTLRFGNCTELIKLLKRIVIAYWYIIAPFMIPWILRVLFLCWCFNHWCISVSFHYFRDLVFIKITRFTR